MYCEIWYIAFCSTFHKGAAEMTAEIIDGRRIAAIVREEVRLEVGHLRRETCTVPSLAVVMVGNDPASDVYVRTKERAARAVGIDTQTLRLGADATEAQVIDLVKGLNEDDSVHGVLVQLPLPDHVDPLTVASAVAPTKDVDGLHPDNVGLLLIGAPRFVPCTPAGIQRMLLESGITTDGKHVVICGRSMIVGRPLAALLMQKQSGANATVTVAHTGTRDLSELTRQADILVAAIDKPKGIRADMVKPGAVVIDVGIHRMEDPSSEKGYRLVGNVDSEGVRERAGVISPAPGGVGPMTVAMLLVNTLKAATVAARERRQVRQMSTFSKVPTGA